MTGILDTWADAALTTLGFFWTAFWAFCLGYLISSMIQVFVTRARMRRSMGDTGPRSVALATFFGFISSSCSFAALSTTRALFQKGAGLVPSLAFLLASTNLVVELGILILVFLNWQFAVAEYIGGLLLVGIMWLVVSVTLPQGLEDAAREHAAQASDEEDGEIPDWRKLIRSREGWRRVARRYFMEWAMVWKDVTFGFTVAGIVATFVPPDFFKALFPGSGGGADPTALQIFAQTLVGPLAAFFTFIGSMGNIPLAGVLFGAGISFAGVMAFIFSDLVVFPVLRVSTQYFGWKMALYILAVFLLCLVSASLILHYGFSLLGALPEGVAGGTASTRPGERFAIDYTFFLNAAFLAASAGFAYLAYAGGEAPHAQHDDAQRSWMDWTLLVLASASILWLGVGAALWLLR